MEPQKRVYNVRRESMTEASIDAGLTRDLFAALGEPLETAADGSVLVNGAWSVRLYHKPFIRWIWFGALLMAIGGLFAALDRRYRLAAKKTAKAGRTNTPESSIAAVTAPVQPSPSAS